MNDQPIAPAPSRRPLHVNWGVFLGVIAMLLAGGMWLDSRDQTREAKTELARKLAEFDGSLKEARLLARNADEATREASLRLAQLEAQVASSREQQLALETLYKELSSNRDQWALADIEQILLTATQQLQLAGNVKAAIIALEAADQRLLQLEKPQFTALRQAINNDLARLRAVPAPDQTGVSLRLNALAEQAEQWPLSSALTQRVRSDKRAQSTPLAQDLLAELRNLVQIRRLDQGEPALLTPGQEFFLRQHLKLRLLNARLALLAHDPLNFKADVVASDQLLSRYFNTRDAAVMAAQTELRKLARLDVSPPLPDLKESLGSIQRFREARP